MTDAVELLGAKRDELAVVGVFDRNGTGGSFPAADAVLLEVDGKDNEDGL